MDNDERPVQSTTVLAKKEQERIDAEIPQILQQVDAKILLQFLKNNPNQAQVNIINVGRVEGGHSQEIVQHLLEENKQLRQKLEAALKFDLLTWLEGVEQPKHYYLMRKIIMLVLDKYETQKDASRFLGISARVFNYWMKKYNIPGYVPMKPRQKKEK